MTCKVQGRAGAQAPWRSGARPAGLAREGSPRCRASGNAEWSEGRRRHGRRKEFRGSGRGGTGRACSSRGSGFPQLRRGRSLRDRRAVRSDEPEACPSISRGGLPCYSSAFPKGPTPPVTRPVYRPLATLLLISLHLSGLCICKKLSIVYHGLLNRLIERGGKRANVKSIKRWGGRNATDFPLGGVEQF